ncbi:putative UDP-glucose 6-dehydrogenase [Halobacteriovorax marinus SJ]|uniref:UDP-glucose 6-dehydrogenase n=1 Tax=Halobacteriovorax marinus (strain ATCC BAA-682 / DSM 15412 / SJ) TaxID=862908 RepID=E1WYW1_HALMS|nr:nucleotide sugar dehydrogenase [Halobacteriovorax marinus]CBW27752.1 putative UDP-glucose 6-dehydrogenase [Halobacteriovorax marinus SJ]
MNEICIHGLGIVGLVQALKLCEDGHKVALYDINSETKESISRAKIPFYERDIEGLLEKYLNQSLRLIDESEIANYNIHFICVGTPSNSNNTVNLDHLISSIEGIEEKGIKNATLVIRSTVPPNTITELTHSKNSFDNIIYFPEFLRQGSAWKDQKDEKTIIYSVNRGCDSTFKGLFKEGVNFKSIDTKSAEFLKYANNTFHALKVTFINELSSLADAMDVDFKEVLDLFTSDTKLNISKAYLSPGLPYGGQCLTKEVKALSKISKLQSIQTPLISSIEESNDEHLQRCIESLKKYESAGFIGIGFKSNSGDIRNSPVLSILNALTNTHYFHPVDHSTMIQAKKHLSIESLIEFSKVIIISTNDLSLEDWEKLFKSSRDILISSTKIKCPLPNYKPRVIGETKR